MSVRHEVLRRCQALLAEHEIDDEEEACEHAVRAMLGDPWSNGGPEAGPADRRRLQLEQLELLLDTRRELFLLAARSAHGEPDREAHQLRWPSSAPPAIPARPRSCSPTSPTSSDTGHNASPRSTSGCGTGLSTSQEGFWTPPSTCWPSTRTMRISASRHPLGRARRARWQ